MTTLKQIMLAFSVQSMLVTLAGEKKREANAGTSIVNVNRRTIIIPLKLLARDEFHGEEAETFLGWQNLHCLKSTTVTLDSKVFR